MYVKWIFQDTIVVHSPHLKECEYILFPVDIWKNNVNEQKQEIVSISMVPIDTYLFFYIYIKVLTEV